MSSRICDLTSLSRIDGDFFAVVEARPLQKKDGTPYMRARLRDATGVIAAVAWNDFEACRSALVERRVVKVRGRIAPAWGGNGEGLELVIERVRLALDGEYDPRDFLPISSCPAADLVQDLCTLVDSLREPLRQLVWEVLRRDLERFQVWPAAEELHHAWLGGLLEHSLEVARVAESIVQVIPGPDRDLVVAGALLHDIGKLDAYEVEASFSASDEGRLLGHVLTGFHRVKVAADAVQTPADLSVHLLHIVASHHGQIEFGAAREPMTREAIVVHYADELSAQLMQANRAIAERSDPNARWISRVRGLKRDVFAAPSFAVDSE